MGVVEIAARKRLEKPPPAVAVSTRVSSSVDAAEVIVEGSTCGVGIVRPARVSECGRLEIASRGV
jgi:hypothetical protein